MSQPKTCKEAAEIFREHGKHRTSYVATQQRYYGYAEMLEFFGDAPVPQKLLEQFEWDRL